VENIEVAVIYVYNIQTIIRMMISSWWRWLWW